MINFFLYFYVLNPNPYERIAMESSIQCPCPLCGEAVGISEPQKMAFETLMCTSCGAQLVLKYDDLSENGVDEPIWWLETASPGTS